MAVDRIIKTTLGSEKIGHVRCDPLAHRPAFFDVLLEDAPKLVRIELAYQMPSG